MSRCPKSLTRQGQGFVGTEADRAAAIVFTFVFGSALGFSATTALTQRLRRNGEDPDGRIQETLAEASAVAEGFPRLRARLATASAAYNASPESTFEHGLTALLDGLEATVTTRATSG